MAFIVVQEYVTWAGIEGPTDVQLAQIEMAIADASKMIAQETGRDFEQTVADTSPLPDTVELFAGNDRNTYFTKQAPIIDVSKLEYWDGTAWNDTADYDGYDYEYTNGASGELGKVYFTEGAKFTSIGYGQQWRITYNYAYADIPYDIKIACRMLTKHLLDLSERQGINSQADNMQQWSYNLKMPEDITRIIERYRRISG